MHGEFPKQILAKARSSTRRTFAIAFILIALAAAIYYVFSASAPQQRRGGRFAPGEGPVPVLVAPAARADVPVYLDAVGTIKALNTVTVRPQVDGKLLSVNFKEGDDIKKGDLLAKIDPVIYQAQLNQALAKKAQDEAQLANSKIDLDRYERLAATAAINHVVIVRALRFDLERTFAESGVHLGKILLRSIEQHRDRLQLRDDNN